MTFHIRDASAAAKLLCRVALLLFAEHSFAEKNWEVGKDLFQNNCTGSGCHAPADRAGRTVAQITSAIADVSTMNAQSNLTDLTSDNISDIAAYLSNLNFPIVSPRSTSVAFGSIAVGRLVTQSFSLPSVGGDEALNISGVSVVGAGYSISSDTCTGAIAVGHQCTVNISLQPGSLGPIGGQVTINHDAFGSPFVASLSGTGIEPFTVSPTSLTFTEPTVVLTTTVTDNKGDRIRICRDSAATFNFSNDYSVDAPFALGGDGCFTSPTAPTASLPRTLALSVRFTQGDEEGPRNGSLKIERVDAGGNSLGSPTTVQLEGNPGPFATFNASRLFDNLLSDPGVEVDNDNILDRSFTLFSEGSFPLVFTGSTFSITGTSAGEYTLAGTGCQTLEHLPAFGTGAPPSCDLTVRFNPSDVGRRTATLTVQIDGITPNNTVTLNGLGILGPRLAVRRGTLALTSGDAVEFGAQTIGGLYPAITVMLSNGGTQGNLDVILPAAGSVAGFTFDAAPGCASLAPDAECAIELRFDPSAIQAYDSPLTIQTRPAGTSDTPNDFQLNLHGQGTTSAIPVLSWTDTTGTPITHLDFADTNAGTPRTSSVRLYNDGPGGAMLQFANVIGLDGPNFVLDTTACASGSVLFEKTSCEVDVQFAPGTAGLKTGSIQFAAGASTPLMLVLPPLLDTSGTAIASSTSAALLLSSTALRFADTVVGIEALPLELKLSSTGSRTLSVLGLDVAAPFAVQGRTCTSVPFTLPPGNECTVTVMLSPQNEGELTGSLRVTTDGTPASQEVALSAKGVTPADVSSGGGCTMSLGDSPADPTLWTLLVLAIAALRYRHRARQAQDRPEPARADRSRT